MVSKEVWDIWEQAAAVASDENATSEDLRDVVAWLLMAMEKTDEPFPEAHYLMANTAMRLDDYDLAAKHVDAALQCCPDDFDTQLLKVDLVARKVNLTDVFDVVKTATSSSSDTVGGITLVAGLLAQGNVEKSQKAFADELEKLLSIFKNSATSSEYSCKKYIYEASVLAQFANHLAADSKTRYIFKELITKIYRTIGSIDPQRLPDEEKTDSQEAYNLYLSAQGRLKKRLEDEAEESKDKCFIATAVYAPTEIEKVDILREYRDRVLLRSRMGRAFVSFYYKASPGVAQIIAKSRILKSMIRALLLEPLVKIVQKRGENIG